jgi:hypothetical protein
MDITILICIGVCGFIIGRLTYSPERWVEDKMSDIERKLFERLSGFMNDRIYHHMERTKETLKENLEKLSERMTSSEVVRISGENIEDVIRKIIHEFRKRKIPEEAIRDHVLNNLNIEEELYERIAGE